MMVVAEKLRAAVMPLAIVALTALATLYAATADGYAPFVLTLVALTSVVGVGLNVLVGLTGQISLGHVGFYAIGAYTAAILTINGVDFWVAFALAGFIAAAIGFVLALPGAARDRALPRHDHHRVRLHCSARRNGVESAHRRRQRPHGPQAARDRRTRVCRA
jgi:branched-subunit amino acid transport system permease